MFGVPIINLLRSHLVLMKYLVTILLPKSFDLIWITFNLVINLVTILLPESQS